jgi:hypothetical protein
MPRRQNPAMLFIFLLVVVAMIWYLHSRSQSAENNSSPNREVPQAHVGPPDIYPDAARTPGAVNADITQDNISETICNPRWSTRSIRPEASYTTRLKGEQIQEYGYSDVSKRDYEEDHFIPLELGGNPTDPRNLWPEPYQASIADGGAHAKDKVENYLHAEVCAGSLTLDQAQHEITEDWYRVYTQSVPH